MKPKAILMTEDIVSLESVYEQSVIDALSEKVDFFEPITSKSSLEARAEELAEVEYIFSTWGMFELTSEEIKK